MVAKKHFIFSTDSIKVQERLRRGLSERFIVQGTATREPQQDFKLFLGDEENKRQLVS